MKKEEMNENKDEAAHDKKMEGYLSMFNFLLTFLVGYYYGFQYAATLAAFLSVFIGYTRDSSPLPLYKQTWALASPFALVMALGVINPSIIPVGLSGVLFTALGLHIRNLQKSQTIKVGIILIVLVLGVYGTMVQYPKFVQSLLSTETFERVPNFEVKDLKGESVQISSLQGKVVLLDFWATWCKPCRDEFKELNGVMQHFKGNDQVVFLITNAHNSGDDITKINAFKAANTYELPFYKDQSGNAGNILNITSFPTLTLIDKKGFLRLHHAGYSNAENLEAFLISQIETLLQEAN